MGCRPSVIKSESGLKDISVVQTTREPTNNDAKAAAKKNGGELKNVEYSLMATEDGFVSTGLDADLSDGPASRIPSFVSLRTANNNNSSDRPQPAAQLIAQETPLKDEIEEALIPTENDAAPQPRTTADPQEEQPDINLPESASQEEDQENRAAIVLQSAFRGQRTRKLLTNSEMSNPAAKTGQVSQSAESIKSPPEPTDKANGAAEEVDIDLGDPDVEKAALKIQGAFKGLKARKATPAKDATPTPGKT